MNPVQPNVKNLTFVSAESRQIVPRMSVTAFIGRFPASIGNSPRIVSGWKEYEALVGDVREPSRLTDALAGFFGNGGSTAVLCPLEPNQHAPLEAFAKALQWSEAHREIGLVCAPGETDPEVQSLILGHCEAVGDRFAILDGPADLGTTSVRLLRRFSESSWGATYLPWVVVAVDSRGARTVPPSGHVAGLYARVEVESGLARPPVNEIVRRAVGVTTSFNRSDQDTLAELGINCIRHLGERGLRVMSERTMAAESRWRSIATRRLSLLIVRSIKDAGQRLEPEGVDNAILLRKDLSALLAQLQNEGVLAGSEPHEGFSLSCTPTPDESGSGGIVCRVEVVAAGTNDRIPLTVVVPPRAAASSEMEEAGNVIALPAS
jgi:hypothetical protein